MPLVEQSVLWLIPGLALALFMVYAMMECTVALLDAAPKPSSRLVNGAELRANLLALNEPGAPYRIVEHADVGMLVHWDPTDLAWRAAFARVTLSTVYGARMLIDDTRREVRWYEWVRTGSLFIGVDESRPRFNFPLYYLAGDLAVAAYSGLAYGIGPGWWPAIEDVREFGVDAGALKARIAGVIAEGRWTWRSTHIWFQTRPPLFHLTRSLLPEAVRLLPRRRFWGVVYPASYVLTLAALLGVSGAITAGNVLIAIGISAGWWALWGLLVWLIVGARSPRRAQRRS
jgi:hypothetical protein